MPIKYLKVETDIRQKVKDYTAPLQAIILLKDENGEERMMSEQLKDFSIAMQKYGLTWSERYNAYIIPDEICFQEEKLKQLVELVKNTLIRYNQGGNIVTPEEREREKNQSYYTKEYGVNYLQNFIHSKLGKPEAIIVLDPAAGEGNLIDGLKIPKNAIWAVEPDRKCCEVLQQKGYKNIINTNFEVAVAKQLIPRPTHIIMNPPFRKQKDIQFYNLACKIAEDKGVIAGIVSENSIYQELAKYDLVLDYNNPIGQAMEILKSSYIEKLSNQMIEFLKNIVRAEWISFENVKSKLSFENTCARAFFIREVLGERKINDKYLDSQA